MIQRANQNNSSCLVELNKNVSFTMTDKTVNIIQSKSYDKHLSNVTLTKGDVLKMAEIIKEQDGNKGSFRTPNDNRVDYKFLDNFKGDKELIVKYVKLSGIALDMLIEKIDATVEFPIIESDKICARAEYYYDEETDESYLSLSIFNE